MNQRPRHAILCPNCRRLVSPDEPRCPHCGTRRPGSWLKNNRWLQVLNDDQQLVKWLIGINAVMFLISLALNPRAADFSPSPFTFLSPDSQSLLLLGATGTIPIGQFGRWWSLLSANYLHGGVLHIVFNMLAVSQIAPLVLREFGRQRTVVIYTLGGVIGFAASFAAGVAFTIGASAALCALIGAAVYFGKHRGGTYGQAVYRQIGGWALGILAFGLLVPGINNWGHIGGFIGGVLLALLLGYEERRKTNLAHKMLSALCILATLACLLWAVVSSIALILGS